MEAGNKQTDFPINSYMKMIEIDVKYILAFYCMLNILCCWHLTLLILSL